MKKTSLFVLFAVIAMVSADAVSEAKENAELEADLAEVVPPAAAPILIEMSNLTAQTADLIEQDQISDSLPLWNRGKELIKKIMPLLLNPTQELVLDNLLKPWLNKYRRIVKSGKATENDMNVYYTIKNAILNAFNALRLGVTDDQAALNAQITADIAETVPEGAAEIFTELSDIATEVSGYWQQDDFESATEPFQRAAKLIRQLNSKLTDQTQQTVVKYLLRLWADKFADILKSCEGNTDTINTYYTELNFILRALVTLGDQQQPPC